MWHEMGEPSSLTPSRKELLKEAANPFVRSENKFVEEGVLTVEQKVEEFGVVYFECEKINRAGDRGYSYNRSILA